MHLRALLWYLKDYPHRQLLSHAVHGVRLHDGLPMRTTIAGNLLSLFDVGGGADAVVDELHVLKQRGWLVSSAGLGAPTAAPPRLLLSPSVIDPRGAVPRKDGGPPRGVAEKGHPRKEELTVDTQEPVVRQFVIEQFCCPVAVAVAVQVCNGN